MFKNLSQTIALATLLLFCFSSCKTKVLNSEQEVTENWKIYNDSLKIEKVTVPGSVQLNLQQNKLIIDPFYGDNELKTEWIEETPWIYTTSFRIEDFNKNYELIFEGLDTYAKISLNNTILDNTYNMFREWKYDISDLVKKDNILSIEFLPVQKRIDSLYHQLDVKLAYDSRVMIRKAPYQFGWDWGPKILPIGIIKPVKIKSWNKAKIEDFQIFQKELTTKKAKIECINSVYAEENFTAKFIYKINNKEIAKEQIKLKKGQNKIQTLLEIDNPKLWWPNGYGDQALYNIAVELNIGKNHIESAKRRIGLRTIKLIQEKDSIGNSLFVEVNGEALFMKGANYIPSDVFSNRLTDEDYKGLVDDAVKSNFNMLRVWGGGIYENKSFYKYCDEKGILIWQDFMFACAFYPGDKEFMNNVKHEAEENILKLRNHPSIAFWCGNNEINEAWHHWGIQKQFNYSEKDSIKVWNDYLQLFENLIPELILKIDPDRDYWPSSPKYGWGNPESMKSGDSHYWGVWWGEEPFEKYIEKTGRFMSEYGFQGHPSLNSIQKYIPKEEQFIGSSSMKTHQKHPRGDELIEKYMQRDFPVPQKFDDYVYMSQVLQAYGIGMAIESHRRNKTVCMGTLYWQYNDCWPVTSWAGIDYYGNWKALQYEVKKLYEPVIISGVKEGDKLKFHIISDLLQNIEGEFEIELKDFQGNIIDNKRISCKLKKNSSNQVLTLPIFDYNLREVYCKASFIYNNQLITKNIFLVKPKDLKLPKSNIRFSIQKNKNQTELLIKSNTFCKSVSINYPDHDLKFTDNYFDLEPNIEKKILIQSKADIQKENISFTFLNQFIDE